MTSHENKELNTFTLETSKFLHQNMSKLAWCRIQLGSVARQHAKKSTYQAGYCWGNSLVLSPPFPCTSESGWIKVANDNYVSAFVDDNSPGITELSKAFEMCLLG